MRKSSPGPGPARAGGTARPSAAHASGPTRPLRARSARTFRSLYPLGGLAHGPRCTTPPWLGLGLGPVFGVAGARPGGLGGRYPPGWLGFGLLRWPQALPRGPVAHLDNIETTGTPSRSMHGGKEARGRGKNPRLEARTGSGPGPRRPRQRADAATPRALCAHVSVALPAGRACTAPGRCLSYPPSPQVGFFPLRRCPAWPVRGARLPALRGWLRRLRGPGNPAPGPTAHKPPP